MKKTLSILAILLMMAAAFSITAFAESTVTDENWGVTFTTSQKLESNFNLKDFNDAIYGMQPGDDVTITLKLDNANPETVSWYMKNDVIKSLEDASKTASGGAYTYILTYTNVKGESETLFDSDSVGGEGPIIKDLEGLHGATESLKDYFYLDTIARGEKGKITLFVALEGETQGNDYQNTLAELFMKFAVEVKPTGENPPPPKIVITGEQIHPLPLIITASVSGVLLMVLSLVGLKLRKPAGKEAEK